MSAADQSRPDQQEKEQAPWQGRPQAADLVCMFAISLSGLYYLAVIPVSPALIGRNPVLLELLGGSVGLRWRSPWPSGCPG